MLRFRTIFKQLTPSWLHEGEGEKILFSLNMILDAMWSKARDGHEQRFPSRAGPSALALIGRDRLIPRGRDESDAAYARRLIAWRHPRGHRVRGNAFALLEQVSAYFGGIKCWTVARKQIKRARSETGTETYEYGYAWNWDGAPVTPRWARFWLVLAPNPEIALSAWPALGAGTWGGGTLGQAAAAGYALGHQGITSADGAAIKRLAKGRHAWKPAGVRAEFAIVILTDHTVTADPAPDGTWGKWSGRNPAFRYWYLR